MKTLDEAISIRFVTAGDKESKRKAIEYLEKYLPISEEANDSDLAQDLLEANIKARHQPFWDWVTDRMIRADGLDPLAQDTLDALKTCFMIGVEIGVEMEKPE